MSTKIVALRIPVELLEEIDAACDGSRGRNKWCLQAFRDALHSDTGIGDWLTTKDKVDRQETDSQLDLLLDKHLVKRMQNKDVLNKLTDAEIAKLAAQRAPKAQNLDEKLMGDVLSLTASIKELPSIPDMTDELNRVKQERERLKTELEFKEALLKSMGARLKKDEEGYWAEFKAMCGTLSERIRELDRGSEARCLEYEDLRDLLKW